MNRGNTSAMRACGRWGSVGKMMEVLGEDGVDVNEQEEGTGKTLLMCACEGGRADKVWALCKAGADVEMEDWSGRRAVEYGVEAEAYECVWVLVKCFAGKELEGGKSGQWTRSRVVGSGWRVWEEGEEGREWLRRMCYGGGSERERRVVEWEEGVHFAVGEEEDMCVEMVLLIGEAEGLERECVRRVAEWLTVTKGTGAKRGRFRSAAASRSSAEELRRGNVTSVASKGKGETERMSKLDRIKRRQNRAAAQQTVTPTPAQQLRLLVRKGMADEVSTLVKKGFQTPEWKAELDACVYASASRGDATCLQVLLEAGASTEHMEGGRGCVCAAVRGGSVACLQLLLDAGADPNACGKRTTPALSEAIKSGDEEMVRVLLGCKATRVITGDKEWQPLAIAVSCGLSESVVRALIEAGALVNMRGMGGANALHVAVQQGNAKHVKLLLEHGADVNMRTNANSTPLSLAVIHGHADIVDVLLEAGADAHMHEGNRRGRSLLAEAASMGNVECLRALLKHGSIVDGEWGGDMDVQSVLMLAAQKNVECVEALIEAGVDVNALGPLGVTAVQTAASLGNLSVVKALVNAGAHLDKVNDHGRPPLAEAARAGHLECVRWLLQKGANVDAVDSEGRTALLDAVRSSHVEVIEMLLESGADPELGNAETFPLCEAVMCRREDCVRVLLGHGVNVNRTKARNFGRYHQEQSVLELAAAQRQLAVVQLLLESGAHVRDIPVVLAAIPHRSWDLKAGAEAAEIVRLLLAAGASATLSDGYSSPLVKAVQSGSLELVQMLLEEGVPVTEDSTGSLSGFGRSSVMEVAMRTASNFGPEIPAALLDAGADLSTLEVPSGMWHLATKAVQLARGTISVLALQCPPVSAEEITELAAALRRRPTVVESLWLNDVSQRGRDKWEVGGLLSQVRHVKINVKRDTLRADSLVDKLTDMVCAPGSAVREYTVIGELGDVSNFVRRCGEASCNLEYVCVNTRLGKCEVSEDNWQLCYVVDNFGAWDRTQVLQRNREAAQAMLQSAMAGDVQGVKRALDLGVSINSRAGELKDDTVLECALQVGEGGRELLTLAREEGARVTPRAVELAHEGGGWRRDVHWIVCGREVDEEVETALVMNMEERERMFEAGCMEAYVEEMAGWKGWVTLPDEVMERVLKWMVV